MAIKLFEPESQYLLKARESRSCKRKVGYPTEDAAQLQAFNATEREGESVIYYPCSSCGKFHLCKERNCSKTMERIKMDWKKVKKLMGSDGVIYVMSCISGDMKDPAEILKKCEIIAYKRPGEVYRYAKPGEHSYPHYSVLNSVVVKKVNLSDEETKLFHTLMEEHIMVTKSDVPVSTPTGLSLGEWAGRPIKLDGRGRPYSEVEVECELCHVKEPAKRKLSMVKGEITRSQCVVPDNLDLVKPRPRTDNWAHKQCMENAGIEITGKPRVTQKRGAPAAPAAKEPIGDELVGVKDEHKVPLEKEKSRGIELPFSDETMLDLVMKLDPQNDKVNDAHARGMGWLFVKELVERIMKK
jgi:hypothetical protein